MQDDEWIVSSIIQQNRSGIPLKMPHDGIQFVRLYMKKTLLWGDVTFSFNHLFWLRITVLWNGCWEVRFADPISQFIFTIIEKGIFIFTHIYNVDLA